MAGYRNNKGVKSMKNEFLKPLTMHSGHVLYGSFTRPRLYVAQIYVSVTGVS